MLLIAIYEDLGTIRFYVYFCCYVIIALGQLSLDAALSSWWVSSPWTVVYVQHLVNGLELTVFRYSQWSVAGSMEKCFVFL